MKALQSGAIASIVRRILTLDMALSHKLAAKVLTFRIFRPTFGAVQSISSHFRLKKGIAKIEYGGDRIVWIG
jgi:hypothetical protein